MRILSVAAICLSALAVPSLTHGGDGLDDTAIYEQFVDSVYWIVSGDRDRHSSGTGFLVDAERGFVLTACHVIPGRDQPVVAYAPERDEHGEIINNEGYYLDDRNLRIECEVVATEPRRDLALLRLKTIPAKARAFPLAQRSGRPGQSVFTIGHSGTPCVLWRHTGGRIRSVYGARLTLDKAREIEARIVETSLPVNKGDSGGPILSTSGEVLGLNCCVATDENQVQRGIDVMEILSFLHRTGRTMNVTLFRPDESVVTERSRKLCYFIVRKEAGKAEGMCTQYFYVSADASGNSSRTPVLSIPPEQRKAKP